MIYKSIELNKEFDTKDELFAALKANAKKIISIKRSQIYKSIDKGQLTGVELISRKATKGLATKENYIYAVINTTDFLDSHSDNHQKGIWNRSVKDQQTKIRYSLDHSTKIADVIAWPEDVKMKVELVEWSELGFDYTGKTEVLIFEVDKRKIDNKEALKIIDKQRPVQNSVSMQYVTIELAIDSTDKAYKEEKKLWDSVIDTVANKDYAIENSFMWIVKEAKIVNESSMVTQGSNSATPIIYDIDGSANSNPSKIEPPKGTQATKQDFINYLKQS